MSGNTVLYKDHVPIISSRLRADAQWGFECQCGNNSLIAEDEVKNLDMLVQNSSPEVKANTIQEIKDRLSAEPRNLFSMERM